MKPTPQIPMECKTWTYDQKVDFIPKLAESKPIIQDLKHPGQIASMNVVSVKKLSKLFDGEGRIICRKNGGLVDMFPGYNWVAIYGSTKRGWIAVDEAMRMFKNEKDWIFSAKNEPTLSLHGRRNHHESELRHKAIMEKLAELERKVDQLIEMWCK